MLDARFVKPRYGGQCFADLPATISAWLTGQGTPALDATLTAGLPSRFETVILLFLDACGWRFVEPRLSRTPLLQASAAGGRCALITAQFPSTTAAHVTTIHSGLPVGQSGIFEWFYYEPRLDALIAPLMFSFAGDQRRETLRAAGIDPQQVFPAGQPTLYERLRDAGVESFVFQPREVAFSTPSRLATRGATVSAFRTLAEGLTNLRLRVEQQQGQGPAYCFLYYPAFDALAHEYGPDAPQAQAELEMALWLIEETLRRPLDGHLRNALLVITADHGQVEVDPRTTIYLNREPALRGIERWLRTDQHGRPLVPAGSARDMFLYIRPELLDEAQAWLSERLAGRAVVARVAELIAAGYFGPPPVCAELPPRAGDLVILPFAGESVWWYEQDRFEQGFYGHHGGLTAAEMEIPLLLYPFGA
ncbi:alkaline phosphatase family protein [Kallotenue papyrolyticum]|uniref:alkaline phosphatase family protein n=1 Tax=Kallotenue papyrolyticum TaxID=1325125 RepID=UPI0004706689|nr:alkaline phosphatase family protein [Kallotenue papyrolyticum]